MKPYFGKRKYDPTNAKLTITLKQTYLFIYEACVKTQGTAALEWFEWFAYEARL